MSAPSKIDLEELRKLCELQCTQSEIASFFGVTNQAVEKRIKENTVYEVTLDSGSKASLTFQEIMQRGYERGKISLRRAQFQLALAGNPALCIWLGKQLLHQRDQWSGELSGKDGKPLALLAVREFMKQDSSE